MITTVTAEELPRVAGLAGWFFHQTGSLGEFDTASFIRSWTGLLHARLGFIMKRTNGTPEPQEAIGVLLYPDPNTGKNVAATAFWYAQDDNSLAGGLLHERVLREAKERGAVRFFVTGLLNQRFGRVEKFLLHAGYKPIEVHYYKDI